MIYTLRHCICCIQHVHGGQKDFLCQSHESLKWNTVFMLVYNGALIVMHGMTVDGTIAVR